MIKNRLDVEESEVNLKCGEWEPPPQKKKKIRRVHSPLCFSKTVLVVEETHLAQNAG